MKEERSVWQRNARVFICFPYDSQVVEVVRCIPNRHWNQKTKEWDCPLESLPEVVEMLSPLGFRFPSELVSQVDAVKDAREEAERRRQEKVAAQEEHKRRRAAVEDEAEQAFIRCEEEKAFVPCRDSGFTRRIKRAGVYRLVSEETGFGTTLIGYYVPDTVVVDVLTEMGRSTFPFDRLFSTLQYLFEINAEAKTVRSFYSTATTRYAKKEHLLEEACRLAAMQDQFTWGWKEDPCPPLNGAKWVLYFEMENKQVSFHAFQRGEGPVFGGEWNGLVNTEFPWSGKQRDSRRKAG